MESIPGLTPPCKDCPKCGCGSYHDECEAYQTWTKERQERQRKLKEERWRFYQVNTRTYDRYRKKREL
jgi:hypothetical protein